MVDRGRFAELAPEWDALAAREPHPFSLQAWLLPWWDAFGADSQLRALVLWRDSDLVAAIALAEHGRAWQSLANEHTPLFAPIALDAEALAELAKAVVEAAPSRLVLAGLPADSAAIAAFESACRDARRPTHASLHSLSPTADLSEGFGTYRESISRKALKNIERQGRRLQRDHDVRLLPLGVAPKIDEAFSRFTTLEQSGWKGEWGTAVALVPEAERFYRGIAVAFSERGSMRFSELWVDDVPAASEFILVHAGRVFLLKRGMDDSRRGLAPGAVLLLAGVEAAAEEGYESYEFLGDVTDFKRRLATGERHQVVLRSYGGAALPLTAYAYRRWVRPRLKAARDRARAALAERKKQRKRPR